MWINLLLIVGGVTAYLCYGGSGTSDQVVTDQPTVATMQGQSEGLGGDKKPLSEFRMSLTKECCTRPAIHSDYEPVGTTVKIGDLDAYQTGDPNSKRVLISAYDIFGFHPNTKQFCDQLSKAGFLIVMPDFFRGSPWDAKNFPPADRQVLLNWIGKAGSWDSTVKSDVQNVISHYKSHGARSFGIFGFCWGGKMSLKAGAELSNDIKAAAPIHGAFIDQSDAEAVQVPVLFLPSKGEADQEPFQKRIQERLGDDASEHYRFQDMEHGFAAARGDFKDELTRSRVEEVIGHVSKFFNKHMPNLGHL